MDIFFSPVPYKCHLEEAGSAGHRHEIFPRLDSRVVRPALWQRVSGAAVREASGSGLQPAWGRGGGGRSSWRRGKVGSCSWRCGEGGSGLLSGGDSPVVSDAVASPPSSRESGGEDVIVSSLGRRAEGS